MGKINQPFAQDKQANSEVFSIMKALAIICVVAGHTKFAPVHDFVYLFHLAVFYFAAGYFFNDRYVHEKCLFVWKRVKGLWFPFWGYGIAFLLLHNAFYRLHLFPQGISDYLYGGTDYLRTVGKFFIGDAGSLFLSTLWFIRSFFVANMAFLFVVTISKSVFKKARGGGYIS